MKILDKSGDNNSIGRTAKKGEGAEAGERIKEEIISSWETKEPVKNKRGVTITVNIEWEDEIEVVTSENELNSGDLLIEIGKPTRADASGETSQDGKMTTLDTNKSYLDYIMQRNEGWDASTAVFDYSDGRIASHEFGHMGGLSKIRHTPNSIMQFPDSGGRPPTFKQFRDIFRGKKSIK